MYVVILLEEGVLGHPVRIKFGHCLKIEQSRKLYRPIKCRFQVSIIET